MTVKRTEEVICDHSGDSITIDGFPCITILDFYKDRRLHFKDYDALAGWAADQQADYVAHRNQHFTGVEVAIAKTAEILALREKDEQTAPLPSILTES